MTNRYIYTVQHNPSFTVWKDVETMQVTGHKPLAEIDDDYVNDVWDTNEQ